MALRGYLIGRSPLRMRTTQFAKASGRLPFAQALRLPRDLSRPFTMRIWKGEQEIPVNLPPNIPQPPDFVTASNATAYLCAHKTAGCEKKPYARLDACSVDDTAAPARANVAVQVTLYVPPPGYAGGIEMTVYDYGSDMAKGLKSLNARIEHCTLSGEVKEGRLWYGDEADEH
ncbi:hypothetical protein D0869_03867 [Hortaea werneckii]|uniref:Uncharacterized protein n=1 Tax=Hortaea werneckii TaxID=91943 RepID=A0A3M6YP94_HORWE|nr:hypothetical protein D0869_03867 [Hortaea werneckii]RMY04833.1 hypothetical protein D0868_06743 [Hortaea werneckii]